MTPSSALAISSGPAISHGLDTTAIEPSIRRFPTNERQLSLSDARSLVEHDDRGKWDIIAPRRELTFKNGELEFPIDLGAHDLSANGSASEDRVVSYDRLSPSSFALGQLCARLGIPAAYIRQCPPILQDQNVNFWLRQSVAQKKPHAGREARSDVNAAAAMEARRKKADKHIEDGEYEGRWRLEDEKGRDESWLLRARHGTLRAVLSERFSPLDNASLLETLSPLLPPHYKVQWISLEDESFHLRLIDPTRAREVLPGDDFFVGVHLANSEVGYRSLTVDAMVYRLVCSNGLVALVKGKSLLRQRHIHVAAPRFKAALEEALEQALGATETLLSQLQGASKQIVPDAGAAIERLSHHWHLSEATEQVAKAALLTEPAKVQDSAYGLINAFTAAAQSLEGEKRYDLESLASSLAQHGVPQFALSTRDVEAGLKAMGREGRPMDDDAAPRGTRPGTRLVRRLTNSRGER